MASTGIVSPFLESATSITITGAEKPCLHNLDRLATVEDMWLEYVELVEDNVNVLALPSLTKVTNSLTIGHGSAESHSVPALGSVVTLTIHGQTSLSEIGFPSLVTVHSLVMYDNSMTLLPGDFGMLSYAYYIYLSGYIDT